MDVLLINDDVDALDKPEDVGVSTNLEFNQINKNVVSLIDLIKQNQKTENSIYNYICVRLAFLDRIMPVSTEF